MKRLKKKFSLAILLALCHFYIVAHEKKAYSFPHKYIFDDLNIEELAISINKNCQSKQFYINLKQNKHYPKFGSTKDWKKLCVKLRNNKKDITSLIIKNLKVKKNDAPPGIITGYYEPTIKVSSNKSKEYKFPILKKNNFYNLKTRKFIDKNFKDNDVILWTNDYVNLFFLQIQGSGIGIYENGEKIKIVYDGNNSLPYKSIGRVLIEKENIKPENIDLFAIKSWLRNNPNDAYFIMSQNTRYIFFKIKKTKVSSNPKGALGIKLRPNFSIAVDKNIYPIGIPFIINYIKEEKKVLAISLDTGSAIKGLNRADLFTGSSLKSEEIAGRLKKKIYLYALIPYSN